MEAVNICAAYKVLASSQQTREKVTHKVDEKLEITEDREAIC